jgi:predicted AAA+ superfamily ATPase
MENPGDLEKLRDPLLFLRSNKEKLICIDEIQRVPQIFSILRSIIDENHRNGQFLLLGSASPDLIKQSSESLAGRICYQELTPFNYEEIKGKYSLDKYWLRGGFPRSLLADSDKWSFDWLQSFIQTFLERDIPQLGYRIPADTMRRLWQMCAHIHGQTLNFSKLGESLGVSSVTIRKYIDILSSTYMIRLLQPFETNLKKRLVKSPKIYIRDTGILNSLLKLHDFNSLLGHPVFGVSWESIVIENIVPYFKDFKSAFYKTQDGAEIDIILYNENMKFAIECKSSMAPNPTKGFWTSLHNINPNRAYIAAPVETPYLSGENVSVGTFEFIKKDIMSFIKTKAKKINPDNSNYIENISKL